MYKIIAALLVALMLSACNPQIGDSKGNMPTTDETNKETPVQGITTAKIPFDMQDSLNPYTAKTMQNLNVCSLLFDSLTTITPDFKAVECLAQSVALNGTLCSVALKDEARFSDGTPITAEDVIYSYELARISPNFGAALSGVSSVKSTGDKTLEFTLSVPDVFFKSSLAFPIIKKDTGAEKYPVQSGRFIYSDTTLTPNPMSVRKGGNIESLKLVVLTGVDNLNFAIKSGEIDYIYSDLRSGWHNNFGTESRSVQLNNFVYVGLNSSNSTLVDLKIRELIYNLMDRNEIVRRIYQGYAVPSYTPLNPAFENSSAIPPKAKMSIEQINEKLDEIGYSKRDSMGFRTNSAGKRLSFRLCINDDSSYKKEFSKLMVEYFNQCAIELVIEGTSFEEYINKLNSKNYDLFIGEVRIPDNMDITSLLTPGTSLSYGMLSVPQLLDSWNSYRAGTGKIEELSANFNNTLPFVPICYRRGIVSFSQSFSANIVATCQDIFYNILEW